MTMTMLVTVPRRMGIAALAVVLLARTSAVVAAEQASSMAAIWDEYQHVRSPCDMTDCVAGGCLFENCAAPLACTGGLCYFKRCREASCEGGACLFDQTDDATCRGGACRFQNMKTTLSTGYCSGGACTLEGVAHPTRLGEVLSE